MNWTEHSLIILYLECNQKSKNRTPHLQGPAVMKISKGCKVILSCSPEEWPEVSFGFMFFWGDSHLSAARCPAGFDFCKELIAAEERVKQNTFLPAKPEGPMREFFYENRIQSPRKR